eukprot:g4126.t1
MKGEIAESYGWLVEQLRPRTGTGSNSGNSNSSSSSSSSRTPKPIRPGTFKAKVSSFAPQFSGYEQHDAQEFLAFLLDGLHEDLNRVLDKPYVPDPPDAQLMGDEIAAALAWQSYLRRNKSIIVDLFQGQLRSVLTCKCCGHTSTKFDPFMYLSLPLPADSADGGGGGGGGKKSRKKRGSAKDARAPRPPVPTLDECLASFTAEEELTGDERWFCGKCRSFQDATKKLDLWKVPPILIVHLKRFQYDRFGTRRKIEGPVRFPARKWDLSHAVQCPQQHQHQQHHQHQQEEVVPETARPETTRRPPAEGEAMAAGGSSGTASGTASATTKGVGAQYDLFAISCHHGTLSSGHYTATCRSQKWNRRRAPRRKAC